MYISYLDQIKQRLTVEGKLNQSDIIRQILSDYSHNEKTKFMEIGERYYYGEHDILKHSFKRTLVYDHISADNSDDGHEHDGVTEVINENNSNKRNIHAFHQLMVDQKASYIVGKPPSITVNNDDAFQEAITTRTNDEDFPDMLYDWVVSASNKGIEWVHPYYDPNGILRYCIVPANEVIPFYDTEHQSILQDAVRFYTIQVISEGKPVQRYKVEWWTANDVTYYVQNEEKNFLLDPSYKCNPAPHWWDVTFVDGAEQSRKPNIWGRVPFIALHNNSADISDLGGIDKYESPKGIKSLIDAYDMISSKSTNDQIDLAALFWVIKGFNDDYASSMIKRLQINKAINISGGDQGDGVTAQQVTLNVEERIKWLDMLRNDIFYFGKGIDTRDDNLGNAPSGVALKFKYTQLDLKANPMILKLKKALKDLFWFITADINQQNGTKYDSSGIVTTINKSIIANDSETVTMINNSRGLVPDKILLAHHPLVDDVNQAMADMAEQQAAQVKLRSQIFLNNDVPPGNENGGGT
jgi:SPP1 family phage portal protein